MVKGMNRLERFAAQNRLSPFVSTELLERIADPIKFRVGNNTANGFESDVLIDLAAGKEQRDKHPEFSRAIKAGLDRAQAWWEREGRKATFGGVGWSVIAMEAGDRSA